MQRTRGSHPRLLNDESVPQNVPGCNPQASLRAAWEHTNSIIPQQQGSQAWDRYVYANNAPTRFTDPTGHWYYDPGCDCLVDNGEPEYQYKENLHYVRDLLGVSGMRLQQSTRSYVEPLPLIYIPPGTIQSILLPTNPISICSIPQENTLLRDSFAYLRIISGEIDPALPDAFTGTNISYIDAVREAAGALNVIAPGNPYSPYIQGIAPFLPLAATGYNVVYDQHTGTGEYSSIELPSLTPLQTSHAILSIFAMIPLFLLP